MPGEGSTMQMIDRFRTVYVDDDSYKAAIFGVNVSGDDIFIQTFESLEAAQEVMRLIAEALGWSNEIAPVELVNIVPPDQSPRFDQVGGS